MAFLLNPQAAQIQVEGLVLDATFRGISAIVMPITLLTVSLKSQVHSTFSRSQLLQEMATPFLVGIGAIGAAIIGRQVMRSGARGASDFVKGGFKAKMDRKEAIAILGLKCVLFDSTFSLSSLKFEFDNAGDIFMVDE